MGLIWSRYTIFLTVLSSSFACAVLGYVSDARFFLPLLALAPLVLVGLHDLLQTSHAILRNYPIIGHVRFILEAVRPEIRQYLIEDESDPVPFSREQRAVVYQRAKNVFDKQPFGSVRDVNAPGYGWVAHSITPQEPTGHDFRVTIGGRDCEKPYQASLLNISGTSFGAVSGNAIQAFNLGARQGGFAHNTGEGSISRHHRRHRGDLIWQIATGYFGCRTPDGRFDPIAFQRQSTDDQVKMIEVKLSQGAKPGHGGVLPRAKINGEIARARGIARNRDCVSPAAHPEFDTPFGLLLFVQMLRRLSGGKPVGIKLCIGHRYEFLAILKAIHRSGVAPDFIVIDGGEGGTGAAPRELANHVGLPLADALRFAHSALIGAGLRDQVKLGASGKIITGYDIFRTLAIGADYVMSARSFMFAVGCIQARTCHSNRCPTGVATQSFWRQRALVVKDKARRVDNFHRNSLKALAQLLGAAGLSDPAEILPRHIFLRDSNGQAIRGDQAFLPLAPGSLLDGTATGAIAEEWQRARADSFQPLEPAA